MQYTVKQLGDLAGVSARTLRYYDEIDLLKPSAVTEAGYRLYGPDAVDRLQQILLYREMGMGLDQIKRIMNDPQFDLKEALLSHRKSLLQRKAQLEQLLETVERSLAGLEGRIHVTDKEKFEGFKKQLVADNEAKYGKEAREKYGDEAVDASNAKLMGMSPEDWENFKKVEEELIETLRAAMEEGDPDSDLGLKVGELHRRWLSFTWQSYSAEAHRGLAEMYVADERFKAHYDQYSPGAAEFLRNCIFAYTEKKRG
ncbi:MAG: MerR family transcriptional regulator [Firmicutes bacterium]|nr:MerR family transcriptional regulator [Bacillota bacterium]